MNLSKFADLPETITEGEIILLFRELMRMPATTGAADKGALMRALWEVADKQWHTYELLEPAVRSQLDDWLTLNWDPSSVEECKWMPGIVGNIGLPKTLERMNGVLCCEPALATREMIRDGVRAIEAHGLDPYQSLRKYCLTMSVK